MRIYKVKLFHKWAQSQKLGDATLMNSIKEMNAGLIDVDLGSCIFKKRVSISNQGKRGGLRTIVAFKANGRAFFIYGFAKNQQSNISVKELKVLKVLAKEILQAKQADLDLAVAKGKLFEVK